MWTAVRAVRDQVALQIVKLGAPWRRVCKTPDFHWVW